MSWRKVKLKEVLKQYRFEHLVQNHIEYKQVTISKYDGVTYRGMKLGKDIGRKRQFVINLDEHPNTLMFVRQGVKDGAIGIATEAVNGCIVTENMPMFSIHDIEIDYLELLIKSPYFRDQLARISTTGSAQKSIHERQILEIEIPYPSKHEQLLFIDEITKLKNHNTKLTNELVHQLNLVKKLRQQLLRDAVLGKLDEQDPNDERASVLLQKIKAEKQQLIKEKSLKKEKELPQLKPEDISFDIPKNWVWCRLGEVCTQLFDGPFGSHLKTEDYTKTGIQVIRLENLGQMIFKQEKETFISEQKYQTIRNHTVYEGDIIIGSFLADGVKCVVLPKLSQIAIAKADCFTIRISHHLLLHTFVMYLLSSSVMFTELAKLLRGMTRLRINTTQLKNLPIPLPPLGEQHRIVKKLEQVMQTCDALEASIKQSQQQNEQLLQQVLREALTKEAESVAVK